MQILRASHPLIHAEAATFKAHIDLRRGRLERSRSNGCTIRRDKPKESARPQIAAYRNSRAGPRVA